jgi:hypothetical protein
MISTAFDISDIISQNAPKREQVKKQEKVFKDNGGAKGNRTPDLYNAIVALSQLSYDPIMTLL